jgi:hypothetical protein
MVRIAKAVAALREQVNTKWPNRSKVNDGGPDHNPYSAGVVQALDITHDPAHGLERRQPRAAHHRARVRIE